MQTKENIKPLHHWPLCGEFTGDQWKKISIWWCHHVNGYPLSKMLLYVFQLIVWLHFILGLIQRFIWVRWRRYSCLVTWFCCQNQVTRQPHLHDLTHIRFNLNNCFDLLSIYNLSDLFNSYWIYLHGSYAQILSMLKMYLKSTVSALFLVFISSQGRTVWKIILSVEFRCIHHDSYKIRFKLSTWKEIVFDKYQSSFNRKQISNTSWLVLSYI